MLDMPTPRQPRRRLRRRGKAIEFISTRWRDQPSIETIADHVGLSASHFQHVFKRWAGLTPKAFLQAITIERARELLRDSASVLDAAYDVGLSGPSRLHDLFVTHEALTPGDYRRDDLALAYGFHPSPFGEAIVVAAPRGLAGLGFVDEGDRAAALADMRAALAARRVSSRTTRRRRRSPRARSIRALWRPDAPLRIVMIGTDFEVRVWETLLARADGPRDHLFRHRAASRQAEGGARGRRGGRAQPDLLRRPLSSRARPLWRADRLPLGPGAQAGDHRLGGRPGPGGTERAGPRAQRPKTKRPAPGGSGRGPWCVSLAGSSAAEEKSRYAGIRSP